MVCLRLLTIVWLILVSALKSFKSIDGIDADAEDSDDMVVNAVGVDSFFDNNGVCLPAASFVAKLESFECNSISSR